LDGQWKDIASFESELTAMQASLEHAYREQQISRRQFFERQAIVEGLEGEISRIRALHSSENSGPIDQIDFVPLTTKLDEKEAALTVDFLEKKYLYLDKVHRQVQKVLKWSDKVSTGKMFAITIVFRLSSINKILKKVDGALQNLQDDDIELNQYIDQLCSSLEICSTNGETSQDRLQSVIRLLENHERLKQKMRDLQNSIYAAENELRELEHHVRNFHQSRTPETIYSGIPTPSASNSLRKSLTGQYARQIDDCYHTIDVIERFVKSVIEDAPDRYVGNEDT